MEGGEGGEGECRYFGLLRARESVQLQVISFLSLPKREEEGKRRLSSVSEPNDEISSPSDEVFLCFLLFFLEENSFFAFLSYSFSFSASNTTANVRNFHAVKDRRE